MIKYALLVKRPNREWDYYPDPLYESLDKIKAKIDYLQTRYPELNSEYTFKGLTDKEQAEHNSQWQQWVSMID